jgi:GGDEF domain-containing protein
LPVLSLLTFTLGPLAVGLAVAFAARALRRSRDEGDRHVRDLHDLLVAFATLSHVDDREAIARTICRIGTDLTEGTGTALFQPGPGRLLVLGHHGIHPAPPDPELGVAPGLERVLRGGRIQPGDPLLVPLTGVSGVVAALSIARPRRPLDPFTVSLLGLFGWAAGAALERYGAIVDASGRDPITGVGDRAQGTTAIAALPTGDAVVMCEVEGVAAVRRQSGDEAADVLQGHLGLHLRNAIRPGDVVARFGDEAFVVVLREVAGPVDLVVRRVLETWAIEHPHRRLHIGAALHTPGAAPIDTSESARAALFASQRA